MKAAICRPIHGTPVRRNEQAVRALSRAGGFEILELAGPNLNLVRQALAEEAIREGSEMVLWVDADMVFTNEAAFGILRAAKERDALVGALYPEKQRAGRVQAEFKLDPGAEVRCWNPESQLVPCLSIGLGLAAHPVSLLSETAQRLGLKPQQIDCHIMHPWFTPDISAPTTTTDDYVFCANLRRAGFDVWADPRWRVEHVGEYGYTLADCSRDVDVRVPVLRAGWVV